MIGVNRTPGGILDADAKTGHAAPRCEVGATHSVFECDGGPLLVMASGAHRVDTTLLARVLGAKSITKASPQLVRSATDQVIGGVAPTGHPRPGSGRSSMRRWPNIRWSGRLRARPTR